MIMAEHKINVVAHVCARKNIRSAENINARASTKCSLPLYLRTHENRDAAAEERERRDAERREMRGIQNVSTLNYVHNVRMTAIVAYVTYIPRSGQSM